MTRLTLLDIDGGLVGVGGITSLFMLSVCNAKCNYSGTGGHTIISLDLPPGILIPRYLMDWT